MLRPRKHVLRDVGKCIYCGARPTSDEHPIPIGLSGPHVLKRASCSSCATTTSRFERELLRGPLLPMRTLVDLYTREPKKRPRDFPVTLEFADGRVEQHRVPARAFPATLALPRLLPPTYLTGETRPMRMHGQQWIRQFADPNVVRAYIGSVGARTMSFNNNVRAQPLVQLIAKIAYGFAVGSLGLEGLGAVLLPSVVGGALFEDLAPYVGGKPELEPIERDLHIVTVVLTCGACEPSVV
jgi:hypothetical protein